MAYSYENWYGGTPSSLEQKYGELFSGYKMSPGKLGTYTHAAMADQINQVSAKLREGMKNVEMSSFSAEVFETIPKQQFKQMGELAKAANVEITAHTPFSPPIDLAGFGEEGWSEKNRREAVSRMSSSIDRLKEIKPNICITIHPAHIPSTEWRKRPEADKKELAERANQYEQTAEKYEEQSNRMAKLGETKEAERYQEAAFGLVDKAKELYKDAESEKEAFVAVNRETGKMMKVEEERRYDPGKGKYVLETPQELLRMRNTSLWNEQVRSIEDRQKEARKDFVEGNSVIENVNQRIQYEIEEKQKKGEKMSEEDIKKMNEKYGVILHEAEQRIMKARTDLDYVHSLLSTTYDTAYKYDDEDTRKFLDEQAKKYRDKMAERGQAKDPMKQVDIMADANNALLKGLEHANPRLYESAEDFARENVSKSLSEIALDKFMKAGKNIDKTPVLAVENVFPNWVFGRADDLKALIKESREKFVEQAKKKGIDASTAKKAADSIIGATWDIAHINMLRAKGYSEQDIIEETKKIAKDVKKVHMGDNFGFAHTGLAPGMGNVPIKQTMAELEKAGFSGKTILELHGMSKHGFQAPSQMPYGFEAIGSPLYYPTMAEYWTRPSSHVSELPGTYGSFFPVPTELGGGTKKKYIGE